MHDKHHADGKLGSPVEKEIAVKATATAHGQRQPSHNEAPRSPRPLQTGLHTRDLPHGLRLAGITTGYRRGGTYFECLLSLFSWHNQTLNSWTMILGWFVSTWLLVWTVTRLNPQGMDLIAFIALWLCPTVHLPFTVGYHQFLCISPQELRRWRALDVAFIFIASIPLTFALSYFVLPLPFALALTAITIGLSLHAWHNAASLPAGADINKKANTRYVGCVVAVYTFPIVLQATLDLRHILIENSRASEGFPIDMEAVMSSDRWYTIQCAAGIVVCFLAGGLVYVKSFPDTFAPGWFDIVGSAQQLMHLAISGAHVLEWLFSIHMYKSNQLLLQEEGLLQIASS